MIPFLKVIKNIWLCHIFKRSFDSDIPSEALFKRLFEYDGLYKNLITFQKVIRKVICPCEASGGDLSGFHVEAGKHTAKE